MSSSDLKRRLRDILDNISRIRSYIQGVAAQELVADPKTQDAVERCLERICEAARKLGDTRCGWSWRYSGSRRRLSLRSKL